MKDHDLISTNQLFGLVFMFLVGTSILLPPGGTAGKSAWIVMVLGTLFSTLLFYIYTSIQKEFADQTIVEYLQITFGKVFGKAIAGFYIFQFIFLSTLILRNLNDFFSTVVFVETPETALGFAIMLPLVYVLKKGLGPMAKITEIVYPLIIFQIITTTISVAPSMEPLKMLPLFEEDFSTVLKSFILNTGWPYGEIITFTMVFALLKSPKEANKTAVKAVTVFSVLFIIISIRNVMVLGDQPREIVYPSFGVFQMVELPGLGRIDVFIMMTYLSSAVVKLFINYYAAAVGIKQVLSLNNFKSIAFPLALVITFLANIIIDNITETIGLRTTPYYLFSLSTIIPLLLLITAKIKKKTTKKSVAG